jgi:putative flippase GtrA
LTLLRYLLVQIAAYGLDLGTFQLLVRYDVLEPVVANLAGKVPAGIFAFVAHRWFTFGVAGSGRSRAEALRYFALLLLNAPLSSLILAALLTVMSQVTLAKVTADFVSVGLTFALTKYFVFEHRRHAKKAVEGETRGGER